MFFIGLAKGYNTLHSCGHECGPEQSSSLRGFNPVQCYWEPLTLTEGGRFQGPLLICFYVATYFEQTYTLGFIAF